MIKHQSTERNIKNTTYASSLIFILELSKESRKIMIMWDSPGQNNSQPCYNSLLTITLCFDNRTDENNKNNTKADFCKNSKWSFRYGFSQQNRIAKLLQIYNFTNTMRLLFLQISFTVVVLTLTYAWFRFSSVQTMYRTFGRNSVNKGFTYLMSFKFLTTLLNGPLEPYRSLC